MLRALDAAWDAPHCLLTLAEADRLLQEADAMYGEPGLRRFMTRSSIGSRSCHRQWLCAGGAYHLNIYRSVTCYKYVTCSGLCQLCLLMPEKAQRLLQAAAALGRLGIISHKQAWLGQECKAVIWSSWVMKDM